MAAAVQDGYWGPVTATVDWCETNYRLSNYVAEFMNSLTSLFLVAAGLLPIFWHTDLWPWLERRYLVTYISIAIVGIGSIAFHGSLLFEYQMWDEIPMLWTVVTVVYTLLEHGSREPKYGMLLPIGLVLYAGIATYATAYQGGNSQWFSFHTFFASAELPCLYLVYSFFQRLDASQVALRRLLRRGFWCYVIAIGLWLIDLTFCKVLCILPGYDFYNLHSYGWHLFVALGLYIMLLAMWYHRLHTVLGVQVKLVDGILPHLLLVKKE